MIFYIIIFNEVFKNGCEKEHMTQRILDLGKKIKKMDDKGLVGKHQFFRKEGIKSNLKVTELARRDFFILHISNYVF